MSKFCIFNNKKLCNECGECDTCEINPNKKCTSCGKCLQMEGYDIKAIKIDEISEETEEINEEVSEPPVYTEDYIGDEMSENQLGANEYDDYYQENLCVDKYEENNDSWELIGDVDGLEDVLEDENTSELTTELFPGLITLSKR